ncbi:MULTISPECIES: acetylornithine transaminase [unclassified Sporosarcina]|uniref:acetylornithine transaminase n=1 Tax=unclassified Sporosarcina TaxID=2647733 RepID=UPI000C16BCFA|nr:MULTISPECIES: acetylornithine transaminase [unclassified Sporosarcina]PID00957.1 aspartate aminotransferase family protein [Sporosarcina sp. P29]PID04897.1 aspartate aminotransferase family protein [Sporosarcina sp. P30]PID08157.1 aspartate aminotransferase family protein [Sporosarcina sp. P31]PID11237.1 aspartate aminotransferase family protein [Sporosarcina sp. P32b]
MTYLFNNYARRAVHLVKGQGTVVTDDKGKDYLDFTSGIAVVSLGHAHPAIVKALQEQSEKLWHTSNLFESPEQEKLAESLTKGTDLSYALFCNSGAEANEAAIKLARKHTGKHHILSFKQSFHGRTFGAMAATGQDKIQQGFGPMLESFEALPFNDVEALKQATNDNVAAIMLEVIQAEGGVNTIEPAFAEAVMAACNEHNILLIIDEVQTGIGRTGTRYAYEQTALKPNIVSLAKGLGGGFPIGALLAGEELFHTFGPGTHGTTFGGNPLAVSVAQTVVDHIFDPAFLKDVQEKSTYLKQQLQSELPKDKYSIRGKGLLVGVHSTKEIAPFIQEAEKQGLLLVPAGTNVIRLLPPLTVSKEEIDQAIAILKNILT